MGYCLGGLLAYLTAARTDSDASVGYYGVNIQNQLDEGQKITHPLMLHIAEADDFVPPRGAGGDPRRPARQSAGHACMSIPSMDHAFARVGGKHFDKASADPANVAHRILLHGSIWHEP